jgi:hypothetical protein
MKLKIKLPNIFPTIILFLLGCYPTIERNNQIECKISDSSAICILRAKYPSPLLKDSSAKCPYSAEDTLPSGIYNHVYLQKYNQYPREYCPSIKDFLFKFKGRVTDTLIERNIYFPETRNVEFRFGEDSCVNIEAASDTATARQGEGYKDYSWFVPCTYDRIKNYESQAIRIFLPKGGIYYPFARADNRYSIWDNWARYSLSKPIEEALAQTPFPALDTSIIIENGKTVLSFYFCDNLTLNIYFEEDSITFPRTIKTAENLNFPALVKLFLSQKGRMDMLLGRINYQNFLARNWREMPYFFFQNNYVKLDKPSLFPKEQQYKDFFLADKALYARKKGRIKK